MTPPTRAQFDALFDPSGVIVAGASSHPGKFGFVALHNILAAGYRGRVFPIQRDAGELLGLPSLGDVDSVPTGAADLLFLCTPAAANPDILRAAARRGVTAAFVASAGYSEAGPDGARAESELVRLADELGILLAGPNGQGLVSTPASLCAQIVAPYPPAGHIGIASQSGNFVSSFMNLAQHHGVGISRAVSAGNAAAVGVADYLDYYAQDEHTTVGLAYLESIGNGRELFERLSSVTRTMPVVLVKGGSTAAGSLAAASHTGSLATDDRVFDGMCRQAGVCRVADIDTAYEVAATFATQPLPRGPKVAVVTTAGGWGVVTADALARSPLDLLSLPAGLIAELDAALPNRWSRSNPIDLSGGETRDTIPQVLEIVARHAGVDAVILLGMGIQANQGRLERTGRFYPDHGLERIVDYHERQDTRFASAAAAVSEATGKPILLATELATTDPDNPAVRATRAAGRLAYPSATRAVTALGHLWRHAQWRRDRGLPDVPTTRYRNEHFYA